MKSREALSDLDRSDRVTAQIQDTDGARGIRSLCDIRRSSMSAVR